MTDEPDYEKIGRAVAENIPAEDDHFLAPEDTPPLEADGFPQARWEGYERCVACGNERPEGHVPDCPIGRIT